MLTYLNYFLASIIAYLGLLLGIILIKFAPEEQKPGKQYFILLKKILFFLILFFLMLFYKVDIILTIILLFFVITLMLNKKINLDKLGLVYFFLGVVFYLSYFSKIFNLFTIETVLIFILGIPTASLTLKSKKKNYYDIHKNAKHFWHTKNSQSEFFSVFVKNLWFFLPVILLYFIFIPEKINR